MGGEIQSYCSSKSSVTMFSLETVRRPNVASIISESFKCVKNIPECLSGYLGSISIIGNVVREAVEKAKVIAEEWAMSDIEHWYSDDETVYLSDIVNKEGVVVRTGSISIKETLGWTHLNPSSDEKKPSLSRDGDKNTHQSDLVLNASSEAKTDQISVEVEEVALTHLNEKKASLSDSISNKNVVKTGLISAKNTECPPNLTPSSEANKAQQLGDKEVSSLDFNLFGDEAPLTDFILSGSVVKKEQILVERTVYSPNLIPSSDANKAQQLDANGYPLGISPFGDEEAQLLDANGYPLGISPFGDDEAQRLDANGYPLGISSFGDDEAQRLDANGYPLGISSFGDDANGYPLGISPFGDEEAQLLDANGYPLGISPFGDDEAQPLGANSTKRRSRLFTEQRKQLKSSSDANQQLGLHSLENSRLFSESNSPKLANVNPAEQEQSSPPEKNPVEQTGGWSQGISEFLASFLDFFINIRIFGK